MVKLFFLCGRRPDITHQEYTRRLLDGHVPIALRHHPMLRRYTVNIVDLPYGGAAPLDSIGALWFDSLADFRERLYDSPAGETIVARDVAGFLGAADAYVTTEHIQRDVPRTGPLGQRSAGVKFVAAVRRTADLTHPEFVRRWLEHHVPLVLADPKVRGYTTNVVDEKLAPEAPDYDGITELWFDSAADFESHVRLSRDESRPIRADIERLVGAVTSYLVGEYVGR